VEFSLDPGLKELQDRGREIGRTLVEPSVVFRDRQAFWDPALFGALAGSGLTGLLLPVEHGGLGLNMQEAVALLEGFGEGGMDAGLALAVGAHGMLCGVPIAALGTVVQRERYLAGIAGGELLAALAMAEVTGGATAAGDGFCAVQVPGGGWRVSGRQPEVVNAPHARLLVITAALEGGGRTAFLIERDTPGLTVESEPWPTTLRTAAVGDLVLHDCYLAPHTVLGTPGAARAELVPMLAALDRTCQVAPWLGIARALAAQIITLAVEQPLFGGPAARSQSVRMSVVDVGTRLELAACLLYRAAWQVGRLAHAPRLDAATAKLFLVGTVRDTVTTAAGITGITPHSAVERARRDMQALAAYGGEEVLRSVIADALLTD
jgi:alkylation response protein AidB-like acyl-CoA dehydrogenase